MSQSWSSYRNSTPGEHMDSQQSLCQNTHELLVNLISVFSLLDNRNNSELLSPNGKTGVSPSPAGVVE